MKKTLLLILLFASSGFIAQAHAHTSEILYGYKIEIGWINEPPITGMKNAIEIFVTTATEFEQDFAKSKQPHDHSSHGDKHDDSSQPDHTDEDTSTDSHDHGSHDDSEHSDTQLQAFNSDVLSSIEKYNEGEITSESLLEKLRVILSEHESHDHSHETVPAIQNILVSMENGDTDMESAISEIKNLTESTDSSHDHSSHEHQDVDDSAHSHDHHGPSCENPLRHDSEYVMPLSIKNQINKHEYKPECREKLFKNGAVWYKYPQGMPSANYLVPEEPIDPIQETSKATLLNGTAGKIESILYDYDAEKISKYKTIREISSIIHQNKSLLDDDSLIQKIQQTIFEVESGRKNHFDGIYHIDKLVDLEIERLTEPKIDQKNTETPVEEPVGITGLANKLEVEVKLKGTMTILNLVADPSFQGRYFAEYTPLVAGFPLVDVFVGTIGDEEIIVTFHPEEVEPNNDYGITSELTLSDFACKKELIIMKRISDGKGICVKESTVSVLQEKGWNVLQN